MARALKLASGLAAALVLSLAAASCSKPQPRLPIPQQRDWYFIRGGYRISTVSQSQSSYTSGRYRITTTTTLRSKGLIGGIQRPRRRRLPRARTPGEHELLRRDPSLATRPFRPLDQQPELPVEPPR